MTTHPSAPHPKQLPGGFLGGYLFPILDDRYSLPLVLGLCAGIAALGAVVTVATLDDGDDGVCGDVGAGGARWKEEGRFDGVVENDDDDGGGGLFGGGVDGPRLGMGMGRGRPLVDPTGEGEGGGKEPEAEDGETAWMMRQRAQLAKASAATSSFV